MINEEWIVKWKINDSDDSISNQLIEVFNSFLSYLEQEKKLSSKTVKKHESSCQSLGGYIINDLFNSDNPIGDKTKSGINLISQYITRHEGPLIFQDNENWQKEIDSTCKQLFKYINL